MSALRLHNEWWVVRTGNGLQAVPYRPQRCNTAVGPFVGEFTARAYIAQITESEQHRRASFLITLMAAAMLLSAMAALVVS